MANPLWTATSLPQYLMLAGYSETPPDLTIRSQMDAGPSKVRRRFTAGPELIQGWQWQTDDQVTECKEFYSDAVEGAGTFGGTARFDWIHPRTGAAVEMRFLSPPTFSPVSHDLYRCDLVLEIMP
jgi:hypothetical protein